MRSPRFCESGSYCNSCYYASIDISWNLVAADTCVGMHDWIQNHTAHMALDDILPCVDNATAQETLLKSREVTSQLVEVINQLITFQPCTSINPVHWCRYSAILSFLTLRIEFALLVK